MNHLAARPAACGRTPITGRSGLVAPIRALADGKLCISWDLHQSGWTRALLEPAEAACDENCEIRSRGGAVKTFLPPRHKNRKIGLSASRARYSIKLSQLMRRLDASRAARRPPGAARDACAGRAACCGWRSAPPRRCAGSAP